MEMMKEEDINRCQIQEWYPHFKSTSIKTLIHELPESFIQYLLDDSGPFLLPLSITNHDAFPNRIHNPQEEQDYVTVEGSEDEADQPTPPPSFPDLESKINSSIQTLGGAIFPKLNWSSPKDSAWISSNGNLKCTSFSEIVLLLRSSDSVIHDLCHPYDSCTNKSQSRPSVFYLALRKWYPSFQPDMEFRCFVRFKSLVGICQREVTNFYPTLLERRGDLGRMIGDFFTRSVKGFFGSESYTFDVYVTKDGRVKVLDFNPWGGSTLSLMFNWEELEEKMGGEDELECRVVESQCGIRPGLKTAVPYDYLDVSSGSGWDQFFRNDEDESREHESFREAPYSKKGYMANKLQIQEDESVSLRITHSNIKSFSTDLWFSTRMTVEAVKEKLWRKCGTSVDSMRLELYDDTDSKVSDLDNNIRPLGFYSPHDGFRLHVIDLDPSSVTSGAWLEDASLAEKYKISDEAFKKLDGTFRKFKEKMGAQLLNTEAKISDNYMEDLCSNIKVGDRRQVEPGEKRGIVKFVGRAETLTSGFWVGIQYDEPLWKHDGMYVIFNLLGFILHYPSN